MHFEVRKADDIVSITAPCGVKKARRQFRSVPQRKLVEQTHPPRQAHLLVRWKTHLVEIKNFRQNRVLPVRNMMKIQSHQQHPLQKRAWPFWTTLFFGSSIWTS